MTGQDKARKINRGESRIGQGRAGEDRGRQDRRGKERKEEESTEAAVDPGAPVGPVPPSLGFFLIAKAKYTSKKKYKKSAKFVSKCWKWPF